MTRGGPIEEAYFDWLCAKVLSINVRTYFDLMQILYSTEFVWTVSGDRNRKEDGLELRQYFLNETGFEKDFTWFDEPCSVLEFFIAFANRASFQTEIPEKDWFWIFMRNLELDEYRQISNSDRPVIEEILYTFVWRTYSPNGLGGMFPIDNSKNDQRQIEIWYQFCEYIDDQQLL